MGYRAVFSYGAMKDAAGQAGKAASRLDSYQDEFQRKVVKALNNYSGSSCGHLSDARNAAARKSSALGRKAGSLEDYDASIRSVMEQCQTADSGVATRVGKLCGDFATRNGISVGWVEEYFSKFGTYIKNKTWLGRKTGDWTGKQLNAAGEAIDRLSYWYQYEGGKYTLWENVKTVLSALVTVAGVVVAFATAGTALAVAAAIVGAVAAVYTLTDGVTNVIYNCKAADAARNGDPASAYRLNNINKLSDSMRLSYSQSTHGWANFYDTSKLAVDIAKLGLDVANLVGSGMEWVTNGKFDPKKTDIWKADKKVLKDGWSAKKELFGKRLTNLKGMIKGGQWKELGKTGWSFVKQWGKNMKDNLFDDWSTLWKKAEPDKVLDWKDNLKKGEAVIKMVSTGYEWTGKTANKFVHHTDFKGGDYGKDVTEGLLDLFFSGFAGRAGKDNDVVISLKDFTDIVKDGKDGVENFSNIYGHMKGKSYYKESLKTFQAAKRLEGLTK